MEDFCSKKASPNRFALLQMYLHIYVRILHIRFTAPYCPVILRMLLEVQKKTKKKIDRSDRARQKKPLSLRNELSKPVGDSENTAIPGIFTISNGSINNLIKRFLYKPLFWTYRLVKTLSKTGR